MTLLSLVNDICGEIALPGVGSVVGTSDPQAAPLLALAKRALAEVSAMYPWPCLEAVHSFVTVEGTAEYDLPADFDRLLTDTAYDTSEDYKLRGGVTPGEWQYITVNANGGLSTGRRFKISGYPRKFKLTPTPDVANTVALLYKSSSLVIAPDDSEKATWTLDADTSKVGDRLVALDLKWRYLRQRGLDYAEDFREAQDKIAQAYAESLAASTLYLAGGQDENPITDGYVRDRDYGA